MRALLWLGLGFTLGFALPYVGWLDHQLQARMAELELAVPTRVWARALTLEPELPMTADFLQLELTEAGYREVDSAQVPGTWSRAGGDFVIASRGFADPEGGALPRRVRVRLAGGRVRELVDLTAAAPLPRARLDPARIATLYGGRQEERQLLELKQLPPLLITGLQAVEDRNFKHHHGVDVLAIVRAGWANLRAGRLVQGGSTITQQLVRNLFLDRGRRLTRKINEAVLALLIEARHDKSRILETYVNEVFLGQQGNQAVHGFAAASQFYFGRRPEHLRTQEIALLVGMVRGPSWYNPRRFPERAKARRNRVLAAFAETGLISAQEARAASAAPLGVSARPQLPRDRFPAFVAFVREQLRADFSAATLRSGGLDIHTTLDPAVQVLAERAVARTLADMGERGTALQAAMVVTAARSGRVLAMVGDRRPGAHGFNRALAARRPIGSLVKPFVYLVALADPGQWSLASLLDDSPLSLRQANGKVWSPSNDDHETHGHVPLIDALAHSWNLATVRLGLAVGVDRVARLLQSLGVRHAIAPHPSLLLGAVDLTPMEVTQLYQYLAADGHALPLLAVRGVLGADGATLHRYDVERGPGEYQGAASLVNYAMQAAGRSGTARAIVGAGLGGLRAAGKTGTSDGQRDSWFAGYSADHLAVAWMGRDDNGPTGLWGSTGALKAWIGLFAALPTRPLPAAPAAGVEFAWVNPDTGRRTTADCRSARHLPFLAGHAPREREACLYDRFRDIFDADAGGMP